MNPKHTYTLNKCTNLVGTLIIMILPLTLFCRDEVLFNLTDSATILLHNTIFEDNIPQISKIIFVNDKLIFSELDKKSVYIFDTQTNSLKSFKPGMSDNKEILLDNFDATMNDIFIVSASSMEIYKINYLGELIASFSLPKRISKKLDTRCFSYSDTLQHFYLLNDERINENNLNKRRHEILKFFSKNNLIYEIDANGKLSNHFGFFDSLYIKNNLLYSYRTNFGTNQKDALLFSQNLSHSINVVNLNNLSIEKLHFPGKYITVKDDELPISTKPYIRNEEYYNHLIRSFHYYDLRILNNSNLCFRVYTDGVLDTTENLASQENNVSKENFCTIPSERLLAQRDMIVNKKIYIQIIDYRKNRLVFDGSFPFKGTSLLNSRNEIFNSFFTYQWDKDNIVIYHYSIAE
jgi:hypothetical protein